MRRLLDDDRLGRSHPEPEAAARTGESALFGGPLGNFDTEAADHARFRALLQPHFSPKHLRSLAPRVEALTTGLLDELADQGPPADLHAQIGAAAARPGDLRTARCALSRPGPVPGVDPRVGNVLDRVVPSAGWPSCSVTGWVLSSTSGPTPETT